MKNRRTCYACEAATRKASAARNHDRAMQRRYGLAEGEYARLYEAQNGRCALCQRATGKTRRLSVDHDHSKENRGMRSSVRGLICRPCNDVLGHARDDTEYFERCIAYLRYPPARSVLL
jgi:hypothetical protein